MSNPLVSIVIPCYNTEQYVSDAIQSALDQTYRNTEVIVVDDGSTDASLDVVKSFGNSVRVLVRENGGAAAARNRGVEIASGELVQFLDADDVLYKNKLERQVPIALEDESRFVFCDADVLDMETQQRLGRWGRTSLSVTDPVVYVLSSPLQTAAPLHWKKRFIAIGGFDESMPPCDDPELHLRIACSGAPFHHLHEALYACRRVANSLSKREYRKCLQLQQRLASDAYERLSESNNLNDDRAAAFAGYLASTARCATRIGLHDLAKECFARARDFHLHGGIPQAYGSTARFLRRVFGIRLTEQIVRCKRAVFRNHEIG